ncbi:MAG: ROK family protein [Ginsengibacter sp.]
MDHGLKILSIDIGGSHIKATILDYAGTSIKEYERVETPSHADPANVLETTRLLVLNFPEYDRISVGFPGYVKNGIIKTAPNLGTTNWADFDLESEISKMLNKPAKVVNDADLQGIGIASGRGFEMMITLGTGFGTALLQNGKLLPHLELSHHPVKKDKIYDEYIGEKAYQSKGEKIWNERIAEVLEILKTVFNYDHLYISGGNAKRINFKLDDNITVVNNRAGIKGGANLWRDEPENARQQPSAHSNSSGGNSLY